MKKHLNFRSISVLCLLACASAPFAPAQTVSTVRILSDPDGPWFSVDGTVNTHGIVAVWPAGSVHQLGIPTGTGYSTNIDGKTRWQFQNWTWSGGTFTNPTVTVIADPSITEYRAKFDFQYRYEFHIVCNPGPCPSGFGSVLVDGATAPADLLSWEAKGAVKTLQAFPGVGWSFAGWTPSSTQNVTGFQNIVTISQPVVVNAVFNRSTQINLSTSPRSDLQFFVDRTMVTPPMTVYWPQGSVHTLSGLDVQLDSLSNRWIFSSWSDGGAMSHDYTVPSTSQPVNLVANYVPAVYPLFTTVPANLRLVVDNMTLPPPYSYIWGVGSVHHVTAPLTQTDAQGRNWVFKSWDDLVTAASRDITMPPGSDVNSYRLVALYTQQARLTVGSSIAGMAASVDGVACTTPCTVFRDAGAAVSVSVPASLPQGDGSRQDFVNWSNGATGSQWSGTLSSMDTSLMATYRTMNKLSLDATPPEGASWSVQPSSADSFYDSQTLVAIGVTPRPGYRFKGWAGDLSGSVPSAALTMSAPHAAVAQFATVPYIAPAGVVNAAGELPTAGVAPGSIASVYGVGLGTATLLAPGKTLPQTLGDVAVHIGDRLLPLYYVSPTQINLQIPPDLPVGKYTLTVSSVTLPDVSVAFTVVRDAPGLFPLTIGDKSYALVLHEDGRLVTPATPATVGELLTAYGTGFGPTTQPRLLAMPLPSDPAYNIVDSVTMGVNGSVFPAEKAYAAAGQIGLDMVQFRLDSSTPAASEISLTVWVNGVQGNSLLLPVQ